MKLTNFMQQEEIKHNILSVMVIGDDVDSLMNKYKLNAKVPQYIKYYYKDAEVLKNKNIAYLNAILDINTDTINDNQKDCLKNRIDELMAMSSDDFYFDLTYGLDYDNEYNALSIANPLGKWSSYKIGDLFSPYLILNDGTMTHQSTNLNIDWKKTSSENIEMYSTAWDVIKGIIEPKTEIAKKIISNIDTIKTTLSPFSLKEEYVKFNTTFWTYAVLDKNGWVDMDDSNYINWVLKFDERFINHLKPNDTITILEYKK